MKFVTYNATVEGQAKATIYESDTQVFDSMANKIVRIYEGMSIGVIIGLVNADYSDAVNIEYVEWDAEAQEDGE